ncbi:MAG: hypothetical protein JO291_15760 [Acidimicrobiia bacterium]|nr:hypothetical protein [Acidimicrobiia bacterium]
MQLLVGSLDQGRWRARSFQNTPARFDGRPELVESLTQELRAAMGR